MAERAEGVQVSECRMSDEEKRMYFSAISSGIDTSKTYVQIPDNDSMLSVICGGEEISISWKDLFRLLKWAYGQLGGKE